MAVPRLVFSPIPDYFILLVALAVAILPRRSAGNAVNPLSSNSFPLSVFQRLAVTTVGCGLIVMLGIAAWLQPNPHGFGTHQGLGLPRCTVLELLGIRCPSCGMTTSWAYLVRGQLPSALRANVGGTLLGLTALVSGPWMLITGVVGRWLGRRPEEKWVAIGAIAVLVITLAEWGLRISSIY